MAQEVDPAADTGDGSNAVAAVPPATHLDPFVARTEEVGGTRSLGSRLLDYSAHAAMIVGLIGFAWTVGDHVVRRPATPDRPAKLAVAATASSDPVADLRSRNRELSDTVHSLQAKLDALQASVGEEGKVAAQVRVLQAGLDTVRSTLGAQRGEQAAALARLDGKIDKVAHEPAAKVQQLADRLGRLEHVTPDPAPTASLPRSADKSGQPTPIPSRSAVVGAADPGDTRTVGARPVPRPAELKVAGDGTRPASVDETVKVPVLTNWVVRDVYQGVALIEGRRGTLEVVPGVSIPGAGVVKSIDRHGSGWTVTTTKGLVAYAAPQRDYRRVDRGPYGYGGGPDYRYDF